MQECTLRVPVYLPDPGGSGGCVGGDGGGDLGGGEPTPHMTTATRREANRQWGRA